MDHGRLCSPPGVVERLVLCDSLAVSNTFLCSLSLVSVELSQDALLGLIKSNASSLKHLYIETTAVRGHLLNQLAALPELKLRSIEVVHERALINLCEHALVPYNNEEEPNMPCHTSWEDDEDQACDDVVAAVLVKEADGIVATVTLDEIKTHPSSADRLFSDTPHLTFIDDEGLPRHRPKWVWARYFYLGGGSPTIFCHTVPDLHFAGHLTEIWRFTTRDGDVAYGDDPLEWFEEWEPEAGDVTEPTPYCQALHTFWTLGYKHDHDPMWSGRYFGTDTTSWAFLRNRNPPDGALQYVWEEDPRRGDWKYEWC